MLAINMIRKHQMYSRLIGINQNDTDKSATDIARARGYGNADSETPL